MKQELSESKVISEEIVVEKKWFGIKQITYTIGEKVIDKYEAAYRPRTQNKFAVDGVQILPILKKKDGTLELIMIANFRPPIGRFCLEFPAGIVEDINFEENALRELKEETGYTAQRVLKIPSVYTHCDPWKSSEAGEMFIGIIDENDPNHRERQDLQLTQNIRVLSFRINEELPEKLSEFANKNNYGILGRVWSLILGLTLSKFYAT